MNTANLSNVILRNRQKNIKNIRNNIMKSVLLPFGKTIYQTDHGQSITTDSGFVVETVLDRIAAENLSVLELGSGNGIISIMLAHYRPKWQISGIEFQPQLVELSRQNAELAEVKVKFIKADLKSFKFEVKFGLIISNPPYFPANDGRISPVRERAISRHEVACQMHDVLFCLKRNLKTNGKAFLLYPVSRLTECEKNVKKVDLNIERKFILPSSKQKERVLLELMHAED